MLFAVPFQASPGAVPERIDETGGGWVAVDVPLLLFDVGEYTLPSLTGRGSQAVQNLLSQDVDMAFRVMRIRMIVSVQDAHAMNQKALGTFPFVCARGFDTELGLDSIKADVLRLTQQHLDGISQDCGPVRLFPKLMAQLLEVMDYSPQTAASVMAYLGVEPHDVTASDLTTFTQNVLDAVALVAMDPSRLCNSWVGFVCVLYLISFMSKCKYVVTGASPPQWTDVLTHYMCPYALFLLFLKPTTLYWNYPDGDMHPVIKSHLDAFVKKFPDLARVTSRTSPYLTPKLNEDVKNESDHFRLVPRMYPYTLTLGMSLKQRREFLIDYMRRNFLEAVSQEIRSTVEKSHTEITKLACCLVFAISLQCSKKRERREQQQGVFITAQLTESAQAIYLNHCDDPQSLEEFNIKI